MINRFSIPAVRFGKMYNFYGHLLIINIEKINMGFHLNKVVFVSINVELY